MSQDIKPAEVAKAHLLQRDESLRFRAASGVEGALGRR